MSDFDNIAEYGKQHLGWETEPAYPKAKIEGLLEGLHEWQADEGITDASMLTVVLEAQVLATKELAYQQATANLIAWSTANGHEPSDARREVIERRLETE